MMGFYSKVGTQLKITKNGLSISLQPGFTSKMVKAKVLRILVDSRLFTFGSGSLAVVEIHSKP
jgi:hypothetical protein